MTSNTIETLTRMNAWRRSDLPVFDGGEMPCPKEFGLAVDDAVRKLRAMEWQPIESAPKGEDAEILIFCERSGVSLVIWCDENGYWVPTWSDNYIDKSEPTHWMPLPTAPEC